MYYKLTMLKEYLIALSSMPLHPVRAYWAAYWLMDRHRRRVDHDWKEIRL